MWIASDFTGTRWTYIENKAIYCGPHGNDLNDGHPARPVRTVARAIVLAKALSTAHRVQIAGTNYNAGYAPVVLSSGIYAENFGTIGVHATYLIGDGTVVLEGGGASGYTGASNSQVALNNLTLQNLLFVVYNGDSNIYAVNVRFKNITNLHANGSTYQGGLFFNCVFLNGPLYSGQSAGFYGTFEFVNCTFINSNFQNNGYTVAWIFRACYLDPSTKVSTHASGTISLYNCNVQGLVKGLTLEAYNTANNNVAGTCINVAPGFNNPAAGDYTLALTSPMRNLAADGSFSGAQGVGVNFGGQADVQLLTNMAYDNGQGGFVLSNTQLKGSVEFVTKDLGRSFVLQEPILGGEEDIIDGETVDAVLSFDADANGVPNDTTSGNLVAGFTYWVKDYTQVSYNGSTYTAGQFFVCVAGTLTYGTAGTGKVVRLTETPNIRVFEMKTSLISATDCNNKTYQMFVYNRVPTIDSNGRSNGDPLYSSASGVPVAARWIKIRATILPNSLA